MTAPDPTAGERRAWCLCMPGIGPHDDGCPAARSSSSSPPAVAASTAGECDMGCQPDWHHDECSIYLLASPPAVAASTGTSEDVETLAKVAEAKMWALADELCTTWHDNDGETERGYLAARWACQYCYDTACTLVDTKWLAAREAAARAEERERIAQAIENAVGYKGPNSTTDYGKGYNAGHQDRAVMDLRIAREGRP